MTFRSFVGAGVLFFVLLSGARTTEADSVILSGFLTKTAPYIGNPASLQFFATEEFSFRGTVIGGIPSEACWITGCAPGTSVGIGGLAAGSDVRGTVTIGTETFPAGSVGSSLFLDFDARLILPAVIEPTSVMSVPLSLVEARWLFPFAPVQPEPLINISPASGIATVFLEPWSAVPTLWQIRRVEYRFGSDVEPIPEPATLLLMATGLAALARRQFACHGNAERRERA